MRCHCHSLRTTHWHLGQSLIKYQSISRRWTGGIRWICSGRTQHDISSIPWDTLNFPSHVRKNEVWDDLISTRPLYGIRDYSQLRGGCWHLCPRAAKYRLSCWPQLEWPLKGFSWPERLILLARQSYCNWGGSRVKWGDTEANWLPSSIQTRVGAFFGWILPWNPNGHRSVGRSETCKIGAPWIQYRPSAAFEEMLSWVIPSCGDG